MAVLTSRMAAAVDALVDLANTSTELSAANVAVIDGPFNQAQHGVAETEARLFIGTSDPYGDGESVAVDGDQSFRNIGARWRDETFEVHCLAEGWNGDGDLRAARNTAVTVFAALEVALRPTPDAPAAYSPSRAVAWAGIGKESITSEYTDDGVYVRVDFTIQCRANLVQ